MKHYTLIIASMLLLLFSCKSQKDVSRSVVNQTRGESLVTTDDSIETHRETAAQSNVEATQETNTYTIRTEFAADNSVTSITETFNNINLQVDFKSRLDDVRREDFKYNSATVAIDTTSQVINEVVKETKDNRLVQGWEWVFVIIGLTTAILIVLIYLEKK